MAPYLCFRCPVNNREKMRFSPDEVLFCICENLLKNDKLCIIIAILIENCLSLQRFQIRYFMKTNSDFVVYPPFRREFNKHFKLEFDNKFIGLGTLYEKLGVTGFSLFLCKYRKQVENAKDYITFSPSFRFYTLRIKGHKINIRPW